MGTCSNHRAPPRRIPRRRRCNSILLDHLLRRAGDLLPQIRSRWSKAAVQDECQRRARMMAAKRGRARMMAANRGCHPRRLRARGKTELKGGRRTKAKDGLVNGKTGAKAAMAITSRKGRAEWTHGTKKEEAASAIITTRGKGDQKTGAR